MFDIHRKSVQFGNKTLTIESGRIARQADGAVLVTCGETVVLVTVVADKRAVARPVQDFFALSVHYQEKTWAAGRIPGGFIKRETRPSEKEILVSRLIDRPMRPLFPKAFQQETQIIATVISYDQVNNPDILAMIGASAAVAISGIPFSEPIAGVRVGHIDGQMVINPTRDEMEQSRLDLVVAGTASAVTMVESEVDFLTEQEMLDAVMFGLESYQPVLTMINELVAECGKPRWPLSSKVAVDAALTEAVRERSEASLRDCYAIAEKMKRYDAIASLREGVAAAFTAWPSSDGSGATDQSDVAREIFKDIESRVVRDHILTTGSRIDGRSLKGIRPISCEVGILPRVHGTALFTRGETQALAAVTLGTTRDEQIVETLDGEFRERFYLNYSFPPFSVGETGRVGAPGRREIGHGKLATRALTAVLPDQESFPYTIRVTSEITESNGSSSMATVCGAVLAMLDAGVPLAAPVAGIAMGLVKEGDRFAILSDILGDEDHLGDMDFKVAGNETGITALQMDIKITGITREIMQAALAQAHEGRLHILNEMKKVISTPREEMSLYAPRIYSLKINPDKVREVIGSGGKVIRAITEETGCQIDIGDDGMITIASIDAEGAKAAETIIRRIVSEVEKGQVYTGKVVRITDFGAFVNILPNKDGLVHISQISNQRIQKVSDVIQEGDTVTVKVLEIDRQGRIKLTMKEM
ncbi:MAG: polyribonucleotide nucleotidyltransferase [Magnetococcales bacterium]|nr:polyribonucleotide nucleotidyltransferase [Magnetococcales bacterium]